jgi:methyl-accepting chemotaxis protein
MSDVEDLGRLVTFDLKTIKTFYTDEGEGKARNNAAEVAAGVVSGVLALEIPSVKNCTTHIGDFNHKVRLVEMDYLGMGRKLKKLSDKIADLEAKIAAAKGGERIHKKLTNAEAVKQYESAMAEFGETFKAIFETVPKVMNQIKEYKANSKEWKETLKGYSDRTDGWTEYVPALASFATEAGMGIGHVSGEHVVEAAEIAAQHIKIGLEVSTVVLNGTLDTFLEELND